jgi:outer membrane immunogenic protein
MELRATISVAVLYDPRIGRTAMRRLAQVSLSVLVTVLAVNSGSAADDITIPISTREELAVADTTAFDWSGFYAGLYGGVQFGTGSQAAAGLNVGINTQFDFYLLGAEVAVSGLADDGAGETSYGQILGRAGLVISDNMVVYAAGGYGIDLGPPSEEDILLGGGVELSVTDSVSVRAQYLHGFPTIGGSPKEQITFGAAYHF